MTELHDLIHCWLDNPNEPVNRDILADYLEEHGDPRAALLRVVPQLLAVPRRTEPAPDVSAEVYPSGTHPVWRSRRKHWPRLPQPTPYADRYGRNERWRGHHNLGRLLALAMVREHRQYCETRLVVGCELYACQLIDAAERDRQKPPLGWTPLYLWSCRAGHFRCYINVAEDVTASTLLKLNEIGSEYDRERYFRKLMKARAMVWSRMLDLAERFSQIVPWKSNTMATAAAKLQRKV